MFEAFHNKKLILAQAPSPLGSLSHPFPSIQRGCEAPWPTLGLHVGFFYSSGRCWVQMDWMAEELSKSFAKAQTVCVAGSPGGLVKSGLLSPTPTPSF